MLSQIVGLVGYEVWALSDKQDSWPTITALTVAVIREHWWAGLAIFGCLGWLIVHFARRIF